MADKKEKPLSYPRRFWLAFKVSWLFLPLAWFSGLALSHLDVGGGIGILCYFAGIHSWAIVNRGTAVMELRDMSKRELAERVEELELDLYHGKNAVKSRDAMLENYRSMARDGDLEDDVLHEIRNALEAYDQGPSPIRAMASLEFLRSNLKRLGRDYFDE